MRYVCFSGFEIPDGQEREWDDFLKDEVLDGMYRDELDDCVDGTLFNNLIDKRVFEF
jgi:hypothetical protein